MSPGTQTGTPFNQKRDNNFNMGKSHLLIKSTDKVYGMMLGLIYSEEEIISSNHGRLYTTGTFSGLI